jgi:hypothetical protein
MRPCILEVADQLVDHRALRLDHQVVPFVAVLATDVHSTEERNAIVSDDHLGVVALQPRVSKLT